MLLAALFLLVSNISFASGDDDIKKLADLGPGIHKVKFDEKNSLKTCIIVGQAAINTVLGAAKGKIDARKAAEKSAKTAFVQWLKENVSVIQTQEGTTTIQKKGQEGSGGESLKVTGESIDITTEKYKSESDSIIKGMQVIGADLDAGGKIMTVVYGWSPKLAAAASSSKNEMSKDGSESSEAVGSKSNEPIQENKNLKSKTSVSSDAGEFLK